MYIIEFYIEAKLLIHCWLSGCSHADLHETVHAKVGPLWGSSCPPDHRNGTFPGASQGCHPALSQCPPSSWLPCFSPKHGKRRIGFPN